jgi:hypothetical protein
MRGGLGMAFVASLISGAGAALPPRVAELDGLIAQAQQDGQVDPWLAALTEKAHILTTEGDAEAAWTTLQEALTLAKQTGRSGAEAVLFEAVAQHWQAVGEPEAAASAWWQTFQSAQSAQPPQTQMARSALNALRTVQLATGMSHRAAQSAAWLLALEAPAEGGLAPLYLGPDLQPAEVRITTGPDEIARTRLMLMNATPLPTTGTLAFTSAHWRVKNWRAGAHGGTVTLVPAEASASVNQAMPPQPRLNLPPGQAYSITVEIEPAIGAPRDSAAHVAIGWTDTAGRVATSSIEARFEPLPTSSRATAATQVCRARLSPLWSVPLYEELYFRGAEGTVRTENLLPETDAPCRIEVWSCGDESQPAQWLGSDAEGDGFFDGPDDMCLVDVDQDGSPDVQLSSTASVAAVEIRLFPRTQLDPTQPHPSRLSLSLRHGQQWEPTAIHRIDQR